MHLSKNVRRINHPLTLSLLMLFLAAAQLSSATENVSQSLHNFRIKVSANSGKHDVKSIAAYPLRCPTDTPEGAEPEHLNFQFAETKAVLNVYEIEDSKTQEFSKKFPAVPAAILDLQKLFAQKPKTVRNMPVVPWVEGVSNINAHTVYKKSKDSNIEYIRQLQFFQQDDGEVTNDGLLYCAQGLSKDHKFYVSLICPVRAPGLKKVTSSRQWTSKQWTAFVKGAKNYYLNINKTLRDTPDNAFTPKLGDLDNLVNDLTIVPIKTVTK